MSSLFQEERREESLPLPKFPSLIPSSSTDSSDLTRVSSEEENVYSILKPRSESPYGTQALLTKAQTSTMEKLRLRTVSIDSPRLSGLTVRTTSPVSLLAENGSEAALVSPYTPRGSSCINMLSNRRLPFRRPSLRLSKQAKREQSPAKKQEVVGRSSSPSGHASGNGTSNKKGQPLQGTFVMT